MDQVHILMDPVHGPGPRRGSMDQGSMFCTFPKKQEQNLQLKEIKLIIVVYAGYVGYTARHHYMYQAIAEHKYSQLVFSHP